MTGNKDNAIYVVGHINPDTDSIAAAMGYAWLLRDQGQNAVAARAGHLNPQTTWVLEHLGIEPPVLLTDASPRFSSISHRLNTAAPDDPLREVWAIVSRTGGVAPIVDSDGKPYGLVTVLSLFDFLSRTLGTHPRREEMRVGELMDMPGHEAADNNVLQFQASTRIRDVLNRILREEGTDFWVVDESGRYVGICYHREVLNPPRLQLVLVDHNEPGQAIAFIDEADVLEIVDHHRLGNMSTRMPIRFTADVVGSTSTLITERIYDAGLSAPPKLAGLLLAGLLSDTLILTSPTTTERDREEAARLARWACVAGSPLAGETIQSYGEKVISAGTGLGTRTAEEIVSADLKLYEAAAMHFGVAQVEVTSLVELDEYLNDLLEALIKLRDAKGLNFAVLMVTDVVRGSSRLLLTSDVPGLGGLPYAKLPDGTLRAAGVVSRKKQLLPALLSALEG